MIETKNTTSTHPPLWGLYKMYSRNLRSSARLRCWTTRPRNTILKFSDIRKYKIDKYSWEARSVSTNLELYINRTVIFFLQLKLTRREYCNRLAMCCSLIAFDAGQVSIFFLSPPMQMSCYHRTNRKIIQNNWTVN